MHAIRPRKSVDARRLLITGASGLLGANLAFQACGEYEVVMLSHRHGTPRVGCGSHRCDLTDRSQARRCLDDLRPDIVIHCAAMTDVDRCESQPEIAQRVNVETVATIADWARCHRAYLVLVSTDSIFDGSGGPYDEGDDPRPVNHYARTKLAAEEAVRTRTSNALIVRTNFHGWNFQDKMSLSEWVLHGLLLSERLTMFTDVRFSPLLVNDLARVMLDVVSVEARGTYHLAARDSCSKYQFGRLLGEVFGLGTDTLIPVSVDAFPFRARRPKNTVLRVENVGTLLSRSMPSVTEGLRSFRDLLDSGYVAKLKGRTPAWLQSVGAG